MIPIVIVQQEKWTLLHHPQAKLADSHNTSLVPELNTLLRVLKEKDISGFVYFIQERIDMSVEPMLAQCQMAKLFQMKWFSILPTVHLSLPWWKTVPCDVLMNMAHFVHPCVRFSHSVRPRQSTLVSTQVLALSTELLFSEEGPVWIRMLNPESPLACLPRTSAFRVGSTLWDDGHFQMRDVHGIAFKKAVGKLLSCSAVRGSLYAILSVLFVAGLVASSVEPALVLLAFPLMMFQALAITARNVPMVRGLMSLLYAPVFVVRYLFLSRR